MAHWNGKKVIHWPPRRSRRHPDWDILDCGCCHGTRWGGEEPIECKDCRGNGIIYEHRVSGMRALYPGGPFI